MTLPLPLPLILLLPLPFTNSVIAIREENRKKKAATLEVEDRSSENSDSDRVEEGRGVTHFTDALPPDHIPNPTPSLRPGLNSGSGPEEIKESKSL